MLRSSHWRCSVKKCVLRILTKFTGKHLCQSLFFNKKIQRETLAQVFSCEFCEISKNTFPYRTLLVVAAVFYKNFIIKVRQGFKYTSEPSHSLLMILGLGAVVVDAKMNKKIIEKLIDS